MVTVFRRNVRRREVTAGHTVTAGRLLAVLSIDSGHHRHPPPRRSQGISIGSRGRAHWSPE